MKAHCIEYSGKFEGRIDNVEQYNRLKKNGEIDWKSHVKNNLERITIPYELFTYFMELDKVMKISKPNKDFLCLRNL